MIRNEVAVRSFGYLLSWNHSVSPLQIGEADENSLIKIIRHPENGSESSVNREMCKVDS